MNPFQDPRQFDFQLRHAPTASAPTMAAPAPAPAMDYANSYRGPSPMQSAPAPRMASPTPAMASPAPMPAATIGQPKEFNDWLRQFFRSGDRYHIPTAMKAYQDYLDNFYGGSSGGMDPMDYYRIQRDAMTDTRLEQRDAATDKYRRETLGQGQQRIDQDASQHADTMGLSREKFDWEQWKQGQDSSRMALQNHIDSLQSERQTLLKRLENVVFTQTQPQMADQVQKRLDQVVQELDRAYAEQGNRAFAGPQSPSAQPNPGPAQTGRAPSAQPQPAAANGTDTVEVIWKSTGQRFRGPRADLAQFQEGVDYDVAR